VTALDRRGVLKASTAAVAAAASNAAASSTPEQLATAASVTVDQRAFAVDSSEFDRRSYRGLWLANGLCVLLASDPDPACRGAACMEVRVGSMNNPVEWPGLAHFCEHMLFLGTRRFPEESGFARFISSAGGSNNAFTSAETTAFHFDCRGETALPAALDRFADFFVAPLFTGICSSPPLLSTPIMILTPHCYHTDLLFVAITPTCCLWRPRFTASATAREVAAIDAEHAKNRLSDGRPLEPGSHSAPHTAPRSPP
jgi:hypothetical protein